MEQGTKKQNITIETNWVRQSIKITYDLEDSIKQEKQMRRLPSFLVKLFVKLFTKKVE